MGIFSTTTNYATKAELKAANERITSLSARVTKLNEEGLNHLHANEEEVNNRFATLEARIDQLESDEVKPLYPRKA